jgi:uncharacterized membrane protein
MGKGRLEAFSDGVIAILITIMVLDLKLPADATMAALGRILPTLCTYLLSFVFLGIYWNNHHHMLHAAERINGAILWANLHLLFWLSLVPFGTRWIGETHAAPVPMAAYGVVLLCSAIAYTILQTLIIRETGPNSVLARAVQEDVKGKISIVFYVAGICLAFVNPVLSAALYVIVALTWLVPDRRIEMAIGHE